MPKFNNEHIVTYFIICCVIDGCHQRTSNLFVHMASIFLSVDNMCRALKCVLPPHLSTYVQVICQPEMKKNKLYKLNLILNSVALHIMYASCGCPAGKGPNGNCKHIGAFCYAFENFCTLGSTPDFLTCTDVLQSWKPRGPKVAPIPVEMLSARRNEILNKAEKSSVIFDPRPRQFQNCNPNAVEKLRCNLLNKCDKGNAPFWYHQ